jgi:ABC-2 type transport system permease protein
MAIMPMFFLSGALYSVASLPAWLAVLNRLDPLTYAVSPMRNAIFSHLNVSEAAHRALNPGVTWWGWRVPTALEAAVIAALGLVMLSIGIWEFSRAE